MSGEPRRTPRLYADTSVFGGCFDAEFDRPSRMFFDQVRGGRLGLVVSSLVKDEVVKAPAQVQSLFAEMEAFAAAVPVTPEAVALHEAFLAAGIVSPKSSADALHVALATASACTAIVSWNFRHIVHSLRMPLYNGVSVARGYLAIGIHSPPEVLVYGA